MSLHDFICSIHFDSPLSHHLHRPIKATRSHNLCAWYSNSFIFQKLFPHSKSKCQTRFVAHVRKLFFVCSLIINFFCFHVFELHFFYFSVFLSPWRQIVFFTLSFVRTFSHPTNDLRIIQLCKIIWWKTIPQLEAFLALSRYIRVRRCVNCLIPARHSVKLFGCRNWN